MQIFECRSWCCQTDFEKAFPFFKFTSFLLIFSTNQSAPWAFALAAMAKERLQSPFTYTQAAMERNRSLVYVLSVMTGTQFHVPIYAALLAAKLDSGTMPCGLEIWRIAPDVVSWSWWRSWWCNSDGYDGVTEKISERRMQRIFCIHKTKRIVEEEIDANVMCLGIGGAQWETCNLVLSSVDRWLKDQRFNLSTRCGRLLYFQCSKIHVYRIIYSYVWNTLLFCNSRFISLH